MESEETKKQPSARKGATGRKKPQPGQLSKTASSRKEGAEDDIFRIQLSPAEYRVFLERKSRNMAAQGYDKTQIENAIAKINITAIA